MSKLRFRVVETAFKKKAATVETPAERPCEYFAKYVFNREKMGTVANIRGLFL